MVALSRCLGPLALLAVGIEGARISRKRAFTPSTKFIAGVPVLNYHEAYEGVESFVEGETEGEWVVMMNPGTSDVQIQGLCSKTVHGCKLSGHPSKGGVPFLEMRGTEGDLEEVIRSAPGAVKFIEPDQTVHMVPEIASSVEAATWGLNRIGADQRSRTGSSVTVFVFDTGVRHSHNEFGGRALPALDMTHGAPIECNGNFSCAHDRQGHGTHCAGTAAGQTFGVAPGAAVRSCKVLGDFGSGAFSWTYYALDWVAASSTRPAVASMSLGGRGASQAAKDSIDAAVAAGITVVVAGGNSNADACGFTPAFVPSAITVGSTTSTDARSSFSNYGSCTNIWAPGSDIRSAGHAMNDRVITLSGTSMACPHVAGAAALLLDIDPSKASSKVLSELLNKATWGVISSLRSSDTNALLNVATL